MQDIIHTNKNSQNENESAILLLNQQVQGLREQIVTLNSKITGGRSASLGRPGWWILRSCAICWGNQV